MNVMLPSSAPLSQAGPGVAGLFRNLAIELERDDPAHEFPLSLADFHRAAWDILEPGTELVDSWAADYICDTLEHGLELMMDGNFVVVVINGPPRCGKSIPTSICFPAWVWTRIPGMRMIFASHAGRSGLAKTLSTARRLLMKSKWFRERWGDVFEFREDQDEKMSYENDHRGKMQAIGIGGAITGEGGQIIIVDDAIDPKKAHSEAERKSATDYLTRVLYPRLTPKRQSMLVIAEQRTHVDDATGTFLKKLKGIPGVKILHVDLQAEPPEDQEIRFRRSGRVVKRKAGEPMTPELEGKPQLAVSRATLGSRDYETQFNQRPSNEVGNLVHADWWQWYDRLPKGELAVWSWDTAFKNTASAAYTTGQLWVRPSGELGFYFVRQVRERMEFPELLRAIEQAYTSYRTKVVLIEDKASGQSAIQSLKRKKKIPIIGVPVEADKVTRWKNDVVPLVEAGLVYLPQGSKEMQDYVTRWSAAPETPFVDEMDATSQALAYLDKNQSTIIRALGAKKYADRQKEKTQSKRVIAAPSVRRRRR